MLERRHNVMTTNMKKASHFFVDGNIRVSGNGSTSIKLYKEF